MKILWKIEENDVKKVMKFYESNKDNPFVTFRIKKNIHKTFDEITKDLFFKAMVSCLLTTQQRSGPDSTVTKFINTKPFPVQYKECIKHKQSDIYILNILNAFNGLRRKNVITNEITTNLKKLENGLWDKVFIYINNLTSNDSAQLEKEAAKFINDNLKGFGPKQSRNLLQSLGLTQYEIPIDSRITKWLNKFGFPLELTAQALSDQNYYNLISDGFQELCKACNIKPCVMDAVIFSSYDKNWTSENVVW